MAELTIDQALQQAIEAHKAGQVQEADRLYTAILKAQPKHPDANHNMGVLAADVGKVELAIPFFKRALDANPNTGQFWLSYIDTLIKLEKLTDARALLDQAKSKGVKGDSFDKLEQRLRETGKKFLVVSKTAAKVPSQQSHTLDALKLDQAIKLAKRRAKEGNPEEAKRIYQDILTKFPKNKRAKGGIKDLASSTAGKVSKLKDPPQNQLQSIINLYNQGQLEQALHQAETLVKQFPKSPVLYNIQGVALQGLGQLDQSIEAYNNAAANKPDYADAYNNMGVALKQKGKLEEAIEVLNKALAIKPDNGESYYNMGNALREKGKLEEAIEAYNKAVAIKPDYAEAYYNMGIALKEQGKLEDVIEVYNKALAINPDYAKVYNNMSVVFQEQGQLEAAIKACKKALAIKPDYAKAHRDLSTLTRYNTDTAQIRDVERLLQQTDVNETDRCHLLYTHAKMQEDLGYLNAAYASYVAGGDLRQKLLAYEFSQDEHLFGRIKQTAPQFKDVVLEVTGEPIRHTPIFILGMPRSGTTLVEQIVSSHSEITGAGELNYTQQFGADLTVGQKPINFETVQSFRKSYLAELAKRADGQAFITDKMPQNFRYIALICAAFPDAKIVHVQRSAAATCWSNFKHYFVSKGLGYSYNLRDTIAYYGLYKELMRFWSQSYSDRIYNLDYDRLTEDQEPETRRLIKYLGLKWEDACLAPQNNKRSVKTASQQQIRQKVYKGSSQAWRKYEPFLGGVFDELEA